MNDDYLDRAATKARDFEIQHQKEYSAPKLQQEQGLRYNTDKSQLSIVPSALIESVSRVMMYGTGKYNRDNWRKGLSYNETLDSCLRHLMAWKDGEDLDSESSLNHLAHAACNLGFLLEFISLSDIYNKFDDRYKGENNPPINAEYKSNPDWMDHVCRKCLHTVYETDDKIFDHSHGYIHRACLNQPISNSATCYYCNELIPDLNKAHSFKTKHNVAVHSHINCWKERENK